MIQLHPFLAGAQTMHREHMQAFKVEYSKAGRKELDSINSCWTHLGCQDPICWNQTSLMLLCLNATSNLCSLYWRVKSVIAAKRRSAPAVDCDALCPDSFLSWPALRFSFIWASSSVRLDPTCFNESWVPMFSTSLGFFGMLWPSSSHHYLVLVKVTQIF